MTKFPGITEKIILAITEAVKTAYSQSFSTVFLVSITFGGLSLIAALASVSVDDKLDNAIAAKLSGVGAAKRRLTTRRRTDLDRLPICCGSPSISLGLLS
jgi:hypothetical protein